MAKLRIQADLIFDDEDPEAAKVVGQLKALAAKLRTIDPPAELAKREASSIRLHRCFHDEGDRACEEIDVWEKP